MVVGSHILFHALPRVPLGGGQPSEVAEEDRVEGLESHPRGCHCLRDDEGLAAADARRGGGQQNQLGGVLQP